MQEYESSWLRKTETTYVWIWFKSNTH
jgi:hypothetical protein